MNAAIDELAIRSNAVVASCDVALRIVTWDESPSSPADILSIAAQVEIAGKSIIDAGVRAMQVAEGLRATARQLEGEGA